MLVDADKAKEKLAKVCEDDFGSAGWANAAAIRQTDLTDCRMEVGEDNDPEWNSLHCTCGASGVAVMAHEPHCAVVLIESLSAQVAELRRENERILKTHVVVMKEADAMRDELIAQVAELKKALEMIYDKWENGDPCYECPDESAGFLGNAVNLTEEEEHLVLRLIPAIDAAKEGK